MPLITTKYDREDAYQSIQPVLDTKTIGDDVNDTAKSLNLFGANMGIQEIIGELKKEKGRSEHLNEAIDFLKLAQNKLKDYSNDLRDKLDDE